MCGTFLSCNDSNIFAKIWPIIVLYRHQKVQIYWDAKNRINWTILSDLPLLLVPGAFYIDSFPIYFWASFPQTREDATYM